MTRSVKLGLASLLLLIGAVVPPVSTSNTPFNVVFVVISCLLGLIAGTQGNRWWLAVPGSIVAIGGLILFIGFHSE